VAVPRRELGDSGVEVSLFALGSWRTWELIPRDQAASVLDHARSRGIDFLEVARYDDESGSAPIPSGYSEVVFGEAFRASGWPRDEVTIGEKLWWEHWPQQSPSEELDLSLERTGLDHVDFLECDPPPADLPMEDIVGMMGELIAGGRARAWGIVNWEADRVAEAGRAARAAGVPPPKSAQLPYSLAKRDWVESPEMGEALDLCGASVMASYVLAGGILSGKYARGAGEGRMADRLDDPRMASAIAAVPALLEVSDRLGEPPAVLAMAFALSNPRVSTILTGATRPEQIDQNLRALEVLEGLGEEDLAALKAVGAAGAG
jgi:L-glyceraldehyde 3-phosphate reductase